MIIPVKCFTCGEVLGNKYRLFLSEVKTKKQFINASGPTEYLTTTMDKKTVEGEVLDELGLVQQCCRRHMLTHIDVL